MKADLSNFCLTFILIMKINTLIFEAVDFCVQYYINNQ